MNWTKVKLSDLCTEISYGYTTSAIENNTGCKFLRITDIQGGKVEWNTVPFCEIESKNIQKYKLIDGDIVIARTGNSTGENYIYQENNNTVFASYLIRYRIDKKIANPYYVWLNLRTPSWWGFVSGAKSGSAQAGANAKVLGTFELSIPNLEIQDKIADFFQYINKKIQLNTQINQTLEQIAQAIFKSWFVDFDPVCAKATALASGKNQAEAELAAMQAISGKTVEELAQMPSESYAELAEIAKTFPSAFGEDGVPIGWELSTIGDSYDVVMGQSPKGETYNENGDGMLFYQGRAEFGWRFPSPRLFTTEPKRIAEQNSILMSVRAPVGDMNVAFEKCCIGRGLAALQHKSGSFSFGLYQMQSIKPQLNLFNGEGTVFGSINQTNLKNISVIRPNIEIIKLFEEYTSSFDKKIKNNEREIISLRETRDLLLPKLLNGDL